MPSRRSQRSFGINGLTTDSREPVGSEISGLGVVPKSSLLLGVSAGRSRADRGGISGVSPIAPTINIYPLDDSETTDGGLGAKPVSWQLAAGAGLVIVLAFYFLRRKP
jgi:hypothetical protein